MSPFLLFVVSSAFAGGSISGQVTLSGKPIGPVIVYIKQADGALPTTGAEASMSQIDLAFKPGTLVVVAGTTVHFPNLDKVWHNVFSLSTGNEFDLGLYRGGSSQSIQLRKPGEVEVYCNIHPQMAAHVLVVQNRYFGEAKSDGSYVLDNLPPGNYQVVAWERMHKPLVRDMIVVEGQGAIMNFTLEFNDEALQHLNKHNEMYGRYQ